MNISIVIFCYNERENIGPVIQSCISLLDRLSFSYEIIIVDDGSDDGSADVIDRFVYGNSHLKCIRHPSNKGIGSALLSGYAACANEFVCAIPGDGQFDVNELLKIKPFQAKNFYSFSRPETNYNWYRSLLNFSNRIFNGVVLGITLRDVNWVKVYRKEQLEFVNIKLKSSIVESEICAKLIKAGCCPIEIPSVYHKRKSGEAKGGNWRTLNLAIREILLLYIAVRRFRKKI